MLTVLIFCQKTKEMEKTKKKEGNEGNEGNHKTSFTLQLDMIFLVVLFTQPPLSESTKRVPINSIDGTLNQFIMYQSEIFAPSPHPYELHSLRTI